MASSQWRQGRDEFRRESDVGWRGIIEDDVEGVLACTTGRYSELLLNTASAALNDSGGRVIVDTIVFCGGLAVVSAERDAICPSHGRRGNARTEWDLGVWVQSVVSLG